MSELFDKAYELAAEKYPHTINYYEEYADYYVFEYRDDEEHEGGDKSPIVIRKRDMAALNYAPIFFDLDENAPDVGDIISEGYLGGESS